MFQKFFETSIFITSPNIDFIQNELSKIKNAEIKLVKNEGYDLLPFLMIVKEIDLSKYDFIVKLHTKRNAPVDATLNNFSVGNTKWREYLFAFCRSERRLKKTIKLLECNEIGGVSDRHIIVKRKNDPVQELSYLKFTDSTLSEDFMKSRDYSFVAGAIFIYKAKFLQDLDFIEEYAQFISNNDHKESPAHTFERYLGYILYKNNKIIASWDEPNPQSVLYPFAQGMYRFKIIAERFLFFCSVRKKYSKRHILYLFFGIPFYYQRRSEEK